RVLLLQRGRPGRLGRRPGHGAGVRGRALVGRRTRRRDPGGDADGALRTAPRGPGLVHGGRAAARPVTAASADDPAPVARALLVTAGGVRPPNPDRVPRPD